MLKAVKTFEYCSASRYTGYIPKSIHLILECGHDQFRKASRGVPKRAKCRECERNAAIYHGDVDGDGSLA